MSKNIFISPDDRKVIDAIIVATCTSMDITKDRLLSGTDYDLVGIKHQMLYLISVNTALKENKLAEEFNLSRFAVKYAVEKIASQKNVYNDIKRNLVKFCDEASKLLEDKVVRLDKLV